MQFHQLCRVFATHPGSAVAVKHRLQIIVLRLDHDSSCDYAARLRRTQSVQTASIWRKLHNCLVDHFHSNALHPINRC